MRLRQLVLCAGLALALTACGKRESADDRSPSAAPASASAPAAAAQQAVIQQKTAEQAADLPSKITRMNEDGSETVEDVPSDSGAHLIVPAQPTQAPTGQVEVLEFFWYACPHCYAIDPMVESWKKTKPSYISFSRVHVMWNEGHRSLARMYYTLDSMGKLDQLHGEVFKEIHVNGDPLIAADPGNAAESERIQTAFVKKFGISESDFKKAYHSFAVETALQRADELVQRYRIEGVPTFVINGKYVADVRSADGQERLLSLVGDLAAQEHKH